MKTKTFLTGLCILAISLSLQGCLGGKEKNPFEGYVSAVVTVKPNEKNTDFFLQFGDSVKFIPQNKQISPFGPKEVRAVVILKKEDLKDVLNSQNLKQKEYNVDIVHLDSIPTNNLVPSAGTLKENEIKYGNCPLEIIDAAETCVEDGYLTLRYRASIGSIAKHSFSLVSGIDPSDPYTVYLFHNDNGDMALKDEYGLVAFRLSSLPDTGNEKKDLKVCWYSKHDGRQKSHKFKYKTRH